MSPDERSHRTLVTVTPELAAKVRRVLEAMRALGFPMVAVDGKRTTAQQQALYRQGRETSGKIVTHLDGVTKRSRHQDGEAVDCCFCRVQDDGAGWTALWTGPWAAYGACAEAVGLTWGGQWRMRDQCHVELP